MIQVSFDVVLTDDDGHTVTIIVDDEAHGISWQISPDSSEGVLRGPVDKDQLDEIRASLISEGTPTPLADEACSVIGFLDSYFRHRKIQSTEEARTL